MRLLAATLLASAALGCSLLGRGAGFDVRRGDIVLFRYPKDPEMTYLKRLVGLPGDTVEVRGGRVFVNGAELAEPYVDPKLNEARDSQPPVFVEPQHYYVLGDNRDNSADSRIWGLIHERYVVGKVVGQVGGREGRLCDSG